MHRLFTVTALIVTAGLISASADARPGAGGGPHVRVFDGTTPMAAEPVEPKHKGWINLLSVHTVRWAPGVVSRNVKIQRPPQRASNRNYVINVLDTGGTEAADGTALFLARAARTGRRLPTVVMIGRDRNGRPLRYELKNVLVTGVRPAGASGNKAITISFPKVEW